jgi:hypothetical protein
MCVNDFHGKMNNEGGTSSASCIVYMYLYVLPSMQDINFIWSAMTMNLASYCLLTCMGQVGLVILYTVYL